MLEETYLFQTFPINMNIHTVKGSNGTTAYLLSCGATTINNNVIKNHITKEKDAVNHKWLVTLKDIGTRPAILTPNKQEKI